MGSVLPARCDSSSDSRDRLIDDIESPRRKVDSELSKSEDADPDFECDMLGVRGGVIMPLSCMLWRCCAPMVEARCLVGDAGGVYRVRADCLLL